MFTPITRLAAPAAAALLLLAACGGGDPDPVADAACAPGSAASAPVVERERIPAPPCNDQAL